jgi:hypothetical protein
VVFEARYCAIIWLGGFGGVTLVCFVHMLRWFNTYFFIATFAKKIWKAVQVTFNIDVPLSMFHGWITGLGNQFKKLVLVGVVALCWARWTSMNDMVFVNSPSKTYMQVLFWETYWLCQWVQLQWHEELAKEIRDACRSVEAIVMQVFVTHCWRFSNRIAAA